MKKISFYTNSSTTRKIDQLLKNTTSDSLETLIINLIEEAHKRLPRDKKK